MIFRYTRIFVVVNLLLLSSNLVFSQESLDSMDNKNVSVLNEELRKIRNEARKINSSISNITSAITGEIRLWTTATPPTGWLICDGSAISRTTYSTLYGVIGTTYGVGDSSTTFNIPNLKGKIPIGYNSAETPFDSLAETGGAHTLTEAQLASHAHNILTSLGAGNYRGIIDGGNDDSLLAGTGATGGGDSEFVGSGDPHYHPYIVLNYIIKT
jgi:microcystin-dependent protein